MYLPNSLGTLLQTMADNVTQKLAEGGRKSDLQPITTYFT